MSTDNTPKRSKNPFINMANDAKAKQGTFPNSTATNKGSAPKPTKGFGAPMRKSSGRGR